MQGSKRDKFSKKIRADCSITAAAYLLLDTPTMYFETMYRTKKLVRYEV